MPHDFNKFPELTNSQLRYYYFESPHKQILNDINATVVKVTDGDTIRVLWSERDFDFPVRFLNINAPEMNEGGEDAKIYLEDLILGDDVTIKINQNKRVGKWGRLLGEIIHDGINVGQQMLRERIVTTFEGRNKGKLPDINKVLREEKWL